MYGWIIALVLSLGIATGAYFYVTITQDLIKDLRDNNAKFELALETSAQTISNYKKTIKENEIAYRILEDKYEKSTQYEDELLQKLRRHDLTNLVSKKPGLTGKAINEATEKVFSDLESITARE